ncbi:hypothetical protein [Negadavirga shengliensis]|uniref:Glycine zipper n=1 Tax=Negadavirga shengliensis TaxID=1389218 RepID=A0ABV9T851_9BACT
MKNYNNFIGIVCLLFLMGCSGFEDDLALESSDGLVDNSENIQKMIQSFDKTLAALLEGETELSEEDLGDIFLKEARDAGLEIVSYKDHHPNARTSSDGIVYSDAFYDYSRLIAQPTSYNSSGGYSVSLSNAITEVRYSNMPLYERQILVDNMMFMDSFVNWMNYANYTYTGGGYTVIMGCDGWWSCWGRCAAGTMGSALTGAIVGCGVGAAVGGAVGTVVPGVGTATGVIVGCAAAGVIGLVGGGMEGAAKYCES